MLINFSKQDNLSRLHKSNVLCMRCNIIVNFPHVPSLLYTVFIISR